MSYDDILDVKEWVEYAGSDYSAAVDLAAKPNPYYARHVCYHCQQAAEKILKAYLIAKECKLPEKTHNLVKLRKSCAAHLSDFRDLEDQCLTLDEYITATRYPSDKKLTSTDVEQALKDAAQVLEFTVSKLKDLGYE